MAYATHLSRKYRSQTPIGSFVANLNIFDSHMTMRIGMVCVALLGFLYISETNALMFLERRMPAKERVVLEVKNDVRALEIQATQLQASQAVQAAALSHAMVASHEVSYVTSGDSAVAMAPSVR